MAVIICDDILVSGEVVVEAQFEINDKRSKNYGTNSKPNNQGS